MPETDASSLTLSVQVPTLNSAGTLEACLESVRAEGLPGLELLVIDSGSRDATASIAHRFGARVLETGLGLLWSRVAGIRATQADFVLLLDSDQSLVPRSLRRVLTGLDEVDMLFLGERARSAEGPLERLYDADRRINQATPGEEDPETGTVMPRLFRRSLLESAVAQIPPDTPATLRYPDHAILYFECARLSRRSRSVPDVLRHRENTSLRELLRKHVTYGRDAAALRRSARYRPLVARKARPIRGLPRLSDLPLWVEAELLMVLKGIPYSVGLALG